MGDELWIALCLVLIIEGLLPTVAPRRYRSMLQQIGELPEQHLRVFGLILMVVGALSLVWVRSG